MSIAALRDENERLKALLAQTQAALSEHQGALAASEEARRRLEVILGELRRDRFGAKSEKLRPDQYHLPLEDVEIAQGILDAAQERAEAVIKGRSRRVPDQGSHRNRGCLPAHLPRVERIIEPASTHCPCGCGAMTKIGEDVSKRLDVIPAQWRVLVTRRPKYICSRCSGPVAQAHAPEHVVPGGLPTEAAIAHVIVSKVATTCSVKQLLRFRRQFRGCRRKARPFAARRERGACPWDSARHEDCSHRRAESCSGGPQ
ncbi:transposase [Bradyrhizobium sp. USDA 4472]